MDTCDSSATSVKGEDCFIECRMSSLCMVTSYPQISLSQALPRSDLPWAVCPWSTPAHLTLLKAGPNSLLSQVTVASACAHVFTKTGSSGRREGIQNCFRLCRSAPFWAFPPLLWSSESSMLCSQMNFPGAGTGRLILRPQSSLGIHYTVSSWTTRAWTAWVCRFFWYCLWLWYCTYKMNWKELPPPLFSGRVPVKLVLINLSHTFIGV